MPICSLVVGRYCHVIKGRASEVIERKESCVMQQDDLASNVSLPRLEGLRAFGPLLLRVRVVAAVHEQVCHLIVGRRKSLQVAR